ncbi:hypothetical protein Tco_1476451 [Tanacetum coccineum]
MWRKETLSHLGSGILVSRGLGCPATSKHRHGSRDPEDHLKLFQSAAKTKVGQCQHGVICSTQPSPGMPEFGLTSYQKIMVNSYKALRTAFGKITISKQSIIKGSSGYTSASSKEMENYGKTSWKVIRQKSLDEEGAPECISITRNLCM